MAEFKIPKSLLSSENWDKNKKALESKIRAHIKGLIDSGVTDHAEIRKGLEPFKVGDKTFEIRQVNQYINSLKDPTKKGDIQLIDQEYRVRKNERESLLNLQTDATDAATKTRYGRGARNLIKGQQDHHLRFRSLLEPFYKNLDEKQAKELTQWFLENEFPIGNVIENLEGIDQDLHQVFNDSIHTWAKDNQIDVGKFKDAKGTNFRTNRKGQTLVAGGADGEIIDTGKKIPGMQGPKIPDNIPVRIAGKSKFPFFGDMPLNERFPAINLWMETVEEPLLDKTAEIMERQDLRRFGKGSPESKTKAQWLEKWKIDAENVGARARILGANPNIKAADLDSVTDIDVRNGIKTSKMINNLGGVTRKGETIARGAAAIATGDVVGATVAAGTLGAGELLQSSAVQKRVAKQIAELTAKRGAKTAAKMIPGLDILISGAETWDYLKQGKLDQAGIAAVSGAIGWIPVIGDGASAALDFTNTGIDISRMDFNKKKKKKPNVDTNIKNRRTLTSGLKSF